MSRFRQQLANHLVAGHGLAMFVLFAAPLQYFLIKLSEVHLGPALLTGMLMVAGFVGTLLIAPRWLEVAGPPAARRTVKRAVLRWFRGVVGNGDAIQSLARWIDPHWRNPYSGRTLQETACWLASMEIVHWAALVGSLAPICAAFYCGYQVLGFVYILANLGYNLAPILVLRDTRRRLKELLAFASKSSAEACQERGGLC